MSEALYVPVGLLVAGVAGWITAGVVFITAPESTFPKDLLAAGATAMTLSAASYQQSSAKPKTPTRRRTTKKPTP